MGVHRFWRLEVSRFDSSPVGYIAMRSLDLRATPGGPALAVVSVSASAFDPAYPAAHLSDGDDLTAWDSGLVGQTPVLLTFELAVPAAVVQIRVRSSGNVDRRPGRAQVLGSNDGGSWLRYATDFDGTGWSAATDYEAWVNGAVPGLGPRLNGAGLRLNASWPARPLGPRVGGRALRVGLNVGPYRVPGNVYIDGTPDLPVSRRVRLFDRLTAVCVREVWSDPLTGAYLFDKLPMPGDGYFVVTHDHTNVFNAAIKDRITPAL